MGRLALSRKEGQSVLIGDDISVKVVDIKRHSIRLLFEAPNHISIRREELEVRHAEVEEKAEGPGTGDGSSGGQDDPGEGDHADGEVEGE